MTNTDQIILILLMVVGIFLSAAFLTRLRRGYFMIDYSDLSDQSPNREHERTKGHQFARIVFKISKYLIGLLLLFISQRLIQLVGAFILLGSLIYDRKKKSN